MSTFLQQEGAPSLSTSPEAVVFLQNFCEKAMGSRYVNQDAFSPSVVMSEASSSTPIFFILFPGYSPSKEIEAYAREVNHTVENGKLTLISMGQVSFIFASSAFAKPAWTTPCCALCHLPLYSTS